jgi:hypothetical protein
MSNGRGSQVLARIEMSRQNSREQRFPFEWFNL